MFNKELFLTHIKNAPVPHELGEPLVEMKQKSDIDTIADIIGTSNEPRPLQEQGGMFTEPLGDTVRRAREQQQQSPTPSVTQSPTPSVTPSVTQSPTASASRAQERARRFAASQNRIKAAYMGMEGETDPTRRREIETTVTGRAPHEVVARANYRASQSERERRFTDSQNRIKAAYAGMEGASDPTQRQAIETGITGRVPHEVMARANFGDAMKASQARASAARGREGMDLLKRGFGKFKTYMSEVGRQTALNTRMNTKIAAEFDSKQKAKQAKRDQFMSRQNDPDVSRFDKVKDRADYFKQTSNMDLGRVGNQRRADLSASTTTELDKRDRLARAGMDPNREDYDDPIVQLGAHAVHAGRERRAEKKSYGVRPKTGDYRLPGGGYDYAAMKADMRERGEIA